MNISREVFENILLRLRIEWPNIPDDFFEYLRCDIYDSQNVTSEISPPSSYCSYRHPFSSARRHT